MAVIASLFLLATIPEARPFGRSAGPLAYDRKDLEQPQRVATLSPEYASNGSDIEDGYDIQILSVAL